VKTLRWQRERGGEQRGFAPWACEGADHLISRRTPMGNRGGERHGQRLKWPEKRWSVRETWGKGNGSVRETNAEWGDSVVAKHL